MYYNARNEKIVYMETAPAGTRPRLHVFLAGTTLPNPDYAVSHDAALPRELDRYQFEYVTRGRGYVEVGGRRRTVGAGDLFFINKWSPNLYYTDQTDLLEKEFITVSGTLPDHLIQAYRLGEAFVRRHTDAREEFRQIHQSLSQAETLGRGQAFAQVELLLHRLIQLLSAGQAPREEQAVSAAEAMLDYIHHNLESRFTLDDMSRYFYLSKAQLIRVFKARYHVTPMQYTILKRVETSMYLLENSRLSIKAIAERLAFSDSKHYANTFARLTGTAPVKYRKQVVENRNTLLAQAMKKIQLP